MANKWTNLFPLLNLEFLYILGFGNLAWLLYFQSKWVKIASYHKQYVQNIFLVFDRVKEGNETRPTHSRPDWITDGLQLYLFRFEAERINLFSLNWCYQLNFPRVSRENFNIFVWNCPYHWNIIFHLFIFQNMSSSARRPSSRLGCSAFRGLAWKAQLFFANSQHTCKRES